MGRKEGNPTHGGYYTKAYKAWSNMKTRCNNPRIPGYKNYGGRGITYQSSWEFFACFLADMGNPPTESHTLDRIDNNGNYTKENCRWVTHTQNMRNRRVFENNTSGVSHVHFDNYKKRWIARGYVNGVRTTLYSGLDYFEAICARKSWEARYEYHT